MNYFFPPKKNKIKVIFRKRLMPTGGKFQNFLSISRGVQKAKNMFTYNE